MKNNQQNTMAKFKIGDRVRANQCTGVTKVSSGTVVTVRSVIPLRFEGVDDKFGFAEDWFDLVTDYQPITPKVGDKFRVVKDMETNMSCGSIPKGYITTVKVFNSRNSVRLTCPDSPDKGYYMDGGLGRGGDFYLTTEYLEPVGTDYYVPPAYNPTVEWHKPGSYYFIGMDTGKEVLGELQSYQWNPEPIKQTIITKTMNALKKLTQSKDDKALEKAGYIDSCGEPTSKTRDILIALLFTEKKAELVAMAEAEIAEDKA